MMLEDLTQKTRQALENAVTQWINGDFQPMADLLDQIQVESHLEGYTSAIEVLENQNYKSPKKETIHNEYQ